MIYVYSAHIWHTLIIHSAFLLMYQEPVNGMHPHEPCLHWRTDIPNARCVDIFELDMWRVHIALNGYRTTYQLLVDFCVHYRQVGDQRRRRGGYISSSQYAVLSCIPWHWAAATWAGTTLGSFFKRKHKNAICSHFQVRMMIDDRARTSTRRFLQHDESHEWCWKAMVHILTTLRMDA